MHRKLLIILSIAMGLFQLKGQENKIESRAYRATLSTLLSHTVSEVSVKEAADLKDKALFLDARELNEFEVSHIKNALHVGYDNFNQSAIDTLDKNQKIIIYCSVGYRSEKISEKLLEQGFKDVSNLYGGIFEWINQGEKVYINNEQTNNIHPYSSVWGIWLKRGKKVYK